MVETSLKTEKRDEEEVEKNPPKFLKLNSINGATNSLAQASYWLYYEKEMNNRPLHEAAS